LGEVHETVEIGAPTDEVWGLVMDPNRLGDWVTAHREVHDAPDLPLAEGDGFRQKLCVAGKSFDVSWTLVECEAPTLAVWKAKGPKGTGADVRYELSENGDGTRFEYLNDFDLPGGRLKIIAGGIARAPAKRTARKSLARLKRLLES
jgi:carbon monoxide dehydrogenase subunit G